MARTQPITIRLTPQDLALLEAHLISDAGFPIVDRTAHQVVRLFLESHLEFLRVKS
jgi:flagellar hook-length control protein FliK